MSDLVGNPEDRFSHNEAHMSFVTTAAPPTGITGLMTFKLSEPWYKPQPDRDKLMEMTLHLVLLNKTVHSNGGG